MVPAAARDSVGLQGLHPGGREARSCSRGADGDRPHKASQRRACHRCVGCRLQGRKVKESEIVFFAQDKDGNVWLLGELVELYEDGDFQGSSAWIAGMDGSGPGIMMKADPQPGTPSYSQGYAPPPFNWTDRATVEKAGQKVCVPAGCYKDVLVIVEGSKGEGPDAQQLKYYAPGVGYIKVGW